MYIFQKIRNTKLKKKNKQKHNWEDSYWSKFNSMPGLEKSTVKLTKNILKYNRKLQKMYHPWRHEEQGKITTGQIKQS